MGWRMKVGGTGRIVIFVILQSSQHIAVLSLVMLHRIKKPMYMGKVQPAVGGQLGLLIISPETG